MGPNHIIETVNLQFRIYNKSGVALTAAANINTLWSGFGGLCQTTNRGDPVVLYDPLANRWFITQFAFSTRALGCPDTTAGSLQCIAVSQTADPTGSWYRYSYQFPAASGFADYGKFGVWPDGYYMSANQFTTSNLCASTWQGAGAVAFDRINMLQGIAARPAIYFNEKNADPNFCFGGQLPSDMDGIVPPPAGSPNYFMEYDDSTFNCPNGNATDHVSLWKFHADFNTPANSTFGTPTNQPNTILITSSFVPGCPGDASPNWTFQSCVPQPGTTQKLDTLGDRLMNRLGYRYNGTTESLFLAHAVVSGGVVAPRWYEVRNPNGTPTIFQQGTYQPDVTWRWMSSLASDHSGDIALGYSTSSGAAGNFPSLRYAGRIPADPAGTMGQGEATLFAGPASQTGTNRWGDYSELSADPVDDCTFWYTNEYYSGGWTTRIGDFKFNQCVSRGAGEPGPIFLSKSGGNLVITWSNLPVGCGNQNYAVYKSALTSLPTYNHASVTCSTSNAPTFSMAMPADSAAYFIVTSESSFDEGSYGRNSAAVERPVSATKCRPLQTIGVCQ